jgi:hypothetical protein
VRLVGHNLVVARATGWVGRLNGKLYVPLANGELQDFNRERRIATVSAGSVSLLWCIISAHLSLQRRDHVGPSRACSPVGKKRQLVGGVG